MNPAQGPLPSSITTDRLVPVVIPPASAILTATFERDSISDKITLKGYREEKSPEVQTEMSFEDGTLNYQAKVVRDTVYLPAKDSIIYVPQEVPVEVNRLTWEQQTWIHLGKWLLGVCIALLIPLIWKIIKKFIKPSIL